MTRSGLKISLPSRGADVIIGDTDILKTADGFWLIYKSLSNILSENNILDFPDSDGKRLPCSRFYDDWFLYAVPNGADHTYSLLKLREQEYDADYTSADLVYKAGYNPLGLIIHISKTYPQTRRAD